MDGEGRMNNAPEGISPSIGMRLDRLAPGVEGYMVEHLGATYIPLVIAIQPGNGAVGKWLDSLDNAKTWKFPTVLSPILEGMLRRRGFKLGLEWSPEFGEMAEVWIRESTPSAP